MRAPLRSDGRKVGFEQKDKDPNKKGMAKWTAECPVLVTSFLYIIGNYI